MNSLSYVFVVCFDRIDSRDINIDRTLKEELEKLCTICSIPRAETRYFKALHPQFEKILVVKNYKTMLSLYNQEWKETQLQFFRDILNIHVNCRRTNVEMKYFDAEKSYKGLYCPRYCINDKYQMMFREMFSWVNTHNDVDIYKFDFFQRKIQNTNMSIFYVEFMENQQYSCIKDIMVYCDELAERSRQKREKKK